MAKKTKKKEKNGKVKQYVYLDEHGKILPLKEASDRINQWKKDQAKPKIIDRYFNESGVEINEETLLERRKIQIERAKAKRIKEAIPKIELVALLIKQIRDDFNCHYIHKDKLFAIEDLVMNKAINLVADAKREHAVQTNHRLEIRGYKSMGPKE